MSAALAGRPTVARVLLALTLVGSGVGLTAIAGLADVTLHRGVETGAEIPLVQQLTGRDLATNVELWYDPPSQLPATAERLHLAGFSAVRQSFPWAEIEPERGGFVWEQSDAIVDALVRNQITIVAVLHRAPAWARPDTRDAIDGPSNDPKALPRFVENFVARYGDRVRFIQIWDQPNRSDHWGGTTPTAAAYLELLRAGAEAAQDVNPTITIVLAEFDPAAVPGRYDADLAFLTDLYRLGAADLFQIVSIRLDGGVRSPNDRTVAPEVVNLSRAMLFRELMLEMGDAAKPIWATHFGWRAGQAPDGVSPAVQGAMTIGGIERARTEWPWLGPMFVWKFRPDRSGDDDFALSANGGSLFATLESFAAEGGTAAAPTGFLPVDANQFIFSGNWDRSSFQTGAYRTTNETGAGFSVRFVGTGAIVRLGVSSEVGKVATSLDGRALDLDLRASQADNVDIPLVTGLPNGPHTLTMTLESPGQLRVGGLLVERAMPLRWPIVLLIGSGVVLLFLGLRELAITIAEHTGHRQRRQGVDLWPELPLLPEWRPSRRA